jgi:hypothetical protein
LRDAPPRPKQSEGRRTEFSGMIHPRIRKGIVVLRRNGCFVPTIVILVLVRRSFSSSWDINNDYHALNPGLRGILVDCSERTTGHQ